MAKKKKKQVQKRKQAKALKQRSRKKSQRKKPPPRSPKLPQGLPANLPPGSVGIAKQMMIFAQPVIEQAENREDIQVTLNLVQALWNAFTIQYPQEREFFLKEIEPIYNSISWLPMKFDEFIEYMLKRHIYYFPEKHTEEEINRFSEAEIKAAVEAEITSTLSEADYELPDFDPARISALISEEEAA